MKHVWRTCAQVSIAVLFAWGATATGQDRVQLNAISKVEVKGTVVEISGSRRPSFNTFTLSDPPRLVIDISEAVLDGVGPEQKFATGLVRLVKTQRFGAEAAAIARVVITFETEVETDIATAGNQLLVKLPPDPQEAARVLAEQAEAERQLRLKAEQETRERLEREQAEKEEKARLAREEKERLAAEKAAAVAKAKAEKEEKARLEREEKERRAAEKAAEVARAKAEKEEKARLEREEQERVVAEKAAAAAKAKAEKEEKARLAREEKERQAAEKAAAQARARAEKEERERAAEEARLAKLEEERQAKAREAAAAAEARRLAEAETRRRAEADAEQRRRAADEADQRRRAADEARRLAEVTARSERAPAVPAIDEAERLRRQRALDEAAAHTPAPDELAARGGSITYVGFKQDNGVGRIFLRTSSPTKYSVGEDGQRNVVVTLEKTTIGLPTNQRMLDTSFFDTAVSLVRPEAVGDDTVRVTISLKRRVAYRASQMGNELTVEFERP